MIPDAKDESWEVLPLSTLFDDDEKEDVGIGIGIGIAHGRRSLSYYRMPEPLLKLPVLKLDGSSFDVQIERTATVGELKLAVESVFNKPQGGDGIQVSWSHVWSHFCLCYKDEKLIDDRVFLQSLRIKDGDQLCFVKHLSVNYNPTKRQPRNHGTRLEKHRRSLTAPEVLEKIEENGAKKNGTKVAPCQYADDKCHNPEENKNLVEPKEFRLPHFFLRWLSCTGLKSSGRTRSDCRPHLTRSGNKFRRCIKDNVIFKKREL